MTFKKYIDTINRPPSWVESKSVWLSTVSEAKYNAYLQGKTTCDVGKLYIGPYQRPLNQRKYAGICSGLNLDLLEPIIVSKTSMCVLDGGHRLAGLLMRGARKIPVAYRNNLTPEDEAKLFFELNNSRTALSPANMYCAALYAGDPIIKTSEDILDKMHAYVASVPHHEGYDSTWKRLCCIQAWLYMVRHSTEASAIALDVATAVQASGDTDINAGLLVGAYENVLAGNDVLSVKDALAKLGETIVVGTLNNNAALLHKQYRSGIESRRVWGTAFCVLVNTKCLRRSRKPRWVFNIGNNEEGQA